MNQKLTQALKFSAIVVFLSLAGCATTNDVNKALAAAKRAQATADAALAKAKEAEHAAGGAIASCKAEDEKCLKMYKKSMRK